MRGFTRPAIWTLFVLLGAMQAVAGAPRPAPPPAPIQQLRIYEIFEHNREAFHERFRDHALPIMQRHGFQVVSIWESRHDGRIEFVYLLQWPDEAMMTSRWSAFMADEEWSRIKQVTRERHGVLVGGIEEKVLVPAAYSPRGDFVEGSEPERAR